MAIQFISSSVNNGSSDQPSIVMTKPALARDGRFLLAHISAVDIGAIAITGPLGWTKIEGASGIKASVNHSLGVFWRTIGSFPGLDGASYTFSFSPNANFTQGQVMCWDGVSTENNPIDGASFNAALASTVVALGIELSNRGSKLVFLASNYGSTYSATPPEGMTELLESNNQYLADQDVYAAGPTGDRSHVITLDQVSAALVGLKPQYRRVRPGL